MKKYLLSAFAFSVFMVGHAKNVDETTAMNIAKNFYASKPAARGANLSLAYKYLAPNSGSTEQDVYYVFNVNTNDGFVIVSGEDAVTPILGYSNTGTYNVNNLSPEFKSLMENYSSQIQYAKTKQLAANDKIKARWANLSVSPNNDRIAQTTSAFVSPMLLTTWNQEPYYNALVPDPSQVPTGCTATAMAQILKYWSYPPKGTGSSSYISSAFGRLSANFDTTTYNWSAMPDNINSVNMEIAILMYDCGVAVDMDYEPGGSGAEVCSFGNDSSACAQNAYVNYFKYNPSTIQGLMRTEYSDNQWDTLLVNELNNGRPVQYVGYGSAGGHTWVCDGYEPQYNLVYYHMNWGWGGECNGYFELDSLNPPGTGYTFNSYEQALIGIEPVSLPACTIISNIAQTSVSCNNASNGAATVNVTAGTGTAPYTYVWGDGDTAKTKTGLVSGTYTVTITDVNGCTHTESVSIDNPPVLTAKIMQNTDTVAVKTKAYFLSSSKGATTYNWNFGDGGTSTEEGTYYTYNTPGTYTVTLVTGNGNGCFDTAKSNIVILPGQSTTGIGSLTNLQKTITVYPNPSNNVLNIAGTNIKQIYLINTLGQMVMSNLNAAGINNLDVSVLPEGLYLLKIETSNGWVDKKINIVR